MWLNNIQKLKDVQILCQIPPVWYWGRQKSIHIFFTALAKKICKDMTPYADWLSGPYSKGYTPYEELHLLYNDNHPGDGTC